jgi:hypothetical protein
VSGRSIARRLARLRAVSAAEIAHRVRYQAYCALERRAHGRGTLAAPDRLRNGLRRSIRDDPQWIERLLQGRFNMSTAFYAGVVERPATLSHFERDYARERAAAIVEADRVLGGEVFFFGQAFPLVRGRWNHDPVTGAEWPRRYHRDVPTGQWRTYGDVKFVWELNRHQFLTDLGRAAFLTGDAKYVAAVTSLVDDWAADNPYATGVSWACALEPAFRVFSWLWAYFLCLEQLRTDRESHLRWLTTFFDHGRFLHRHLEHYISPFNHLIGEATALYMMGVLFPEFEESAAWRTRGRTVLESEVPRQFYADGGSVEQSPFYHHATLGFYTLAAILGRRNGEEFSPDVWQAIERGIDFSAALVQPDGLTPTIGGADDGKPMRLEHAPWWDFRAFQAIGAVLFERGDFKFVAERFPEDALWLLGAGGLARFNSLAAEPPPASVALPASGYYVMRSGRTPQADYVCIDCGEQAGEIRTDAVPNSLHGHADCLSIVLWLGGQRVLVDSGLFCYNGEPEWEGHFRRTAAHNTARIDARDQAFHLGKMAWSHSYTARPEQWTVRAHEAAFMGSHDGYTRRGGDTIHRRLVWLRPQGYVVIYDEFDSAGEHDVELNFQFAPGTLELVGPDTARYGDVQLAWMSSSPFAAEINNGGPNPDQGWIAPSLGVRIPAPRLTLSGRLSRRATVATVFAAPRTPEGITVFVEGNSIAVRGAVFEDRVAVGGPEVGDRSAERMGPVAIWRV